MQWWLRADVGAEEAAADPAENGDGVRYWRNQATNTFDLTQDTLANRPTFDDPASNHNNEPALSFDGSSTYLTAGNVLNQGTDSFTMFTVFRSPSRTITGNEMLIDKRSGTDRFTLYARANSSNPGLYFLYGDGTTALTSQLGVGTNYTELLDDRPHISVGVVDFGDTAYHYLDAPSGPATADISSIINGQSNGGPLIVGGRSDHTINRWQGTIAEIIMYKGALSSSELNEVGYYLQNKYAVDGAFPDSGAPAGTVVIIK